ncbi:hypothetical protein HYH02_011956 [Chlamydomonas schloesseri]|uniref:Kazal-like domain-containing protein n=1 Tax=Chlamydomonas schloesseri TaxID=2026947 RepID=A0A835TC37_9CHLO|nr:hypothetical protein HYH02_011956 [Chlamydomonas schloesseri]|eukprot:KAG2435456.1 hypothetical protein HYH02_011956 [Chlamydomonas schloesseri]
MARPFRAGLLLVFIAACALATAHAGCEGVMCTADYDPVCCTKTGQTYPNKWCMCPLLLTPVCDTHGRSWGNPCLARCGGVQTGRWRPGPCDSPKRYVGGVEDVTATCGDPVACLVDPCSLPRTCTNPLPPGAVCLSNYCPALTLPGSQQPLGPCTAVWMDPATGQSVPCGGSTSTSTSGSSNSAGVTAGLAATASLDAPCTCPLDRNPVCVGGQTYPSLCMAKCAGVVGKDATTGWRFGVCEGHNPFPTCPGNPSTLPAVRCMAPCSRPCSADPSATCVANPCGCLLTYRGYKVGACGEVWLDRRGAVVDACMPQPDVDIYSCNADSARYMCTADAYSACDAATCPTAPASAKCMVKACDLDYRGQLLKACTPIFYDPATGDAFSNCNAQVPRRLLLQG